MYPTAEYAAPVWSQVITPRQSTRYHTLRAISSCMAPTPTVILSVVAGISCSLRYPTRSSCAQARGKVKWPKQPGTKHCFSYLSASYRPAALCCPGQRTRHQLSPHLFLGDYPGVRSGRVWTLIYIITSRHYPLSPRVTLSVVLHGSDWTASGQVGGKRTTSSRLLAQKTRTLVRVVQFKLPSP